MNENYKEIKTQITSLTTGTRFLITDLSNISSSLYHFVKDINWVGFYFVKDDNLHLGPFNGKPACTYIENGKGVCGYTLKEKKTVYVKNVHEFTGHIACDPNSNSELVIPLFSHNEVVALLDIDSEKLDRFNKNDISNLEDIAKYIETLFTKELL